MLGRYLFVLLTEWEEGGYQQKVVAVISHLYKRPALCDKLATILLQKVRMEGGREGRGGRGGEEGDSL